MPPPQAQLSHTQLISVTALAATSLLSVCLLFGSFSSIRSFPFKKLLSPFSSTSEDSENDKEEEDKEGKRYEVKKEFYSSEKGDWKTSEEREEDEDDDGEEGEGKSK